eukprot:775405-Rhodomonas_salina.1
MPQSRTGVSPLWGEAINNMLESDAKSWILASPLRLHQYFVSMAIGNKRVGSGNEITHSMLHSHAKNNSHGFSTWDLSPNRLELRR